MIVIKLRKKRIVVVTPMSNIPTTTTSDTIIYNTLGHSDEHSISKEEKEEEEGERINETNKKIAEKEINETLVQQKTLEGLGARLTRILETDDENDNDDSTTAVVTTTTTTTDNNSETEPFPSGHIEDYSEYLFDSNSPSLTTTYKQTHSSSIVISNCQRQQSKEDINQQQLDTNTDQILGLINLEQQERSEQDLLSHHTFTSSSFPSSSSSLSHHSHHHHLQHNTSKTSDEADLFIQQQQSNIHTTVVTSIDNNENNNNNHHHTQQSSSSSLSTTSNNFILFDPSSMVLLEETTPDLLSTVVEQLPEDDNNHNNQNIDNTGNNTSNNDSGNRLNIMNDNNNFPAKIEYSYQTVAATTEPSTVTTTTTITTIAATAITTNSITEVGSFQVLFKRTINLFILKIQSFFLFFYHNSLYDCSIINIIIKVQCHNKRCQHLHHMNINCKHSSSRLIEPLRKFPTLTMMVMLITKQNLNRNNNHFIV